MGAAGAPLLPWVAAAAGLLVAVLVTAGLDVGDAGAASIVTWAAVVVAVLVLVLAPAWPRLLPPGGLSDLTHHLLLVDVLERTRHLVDGAASEAALGEMAHYTPGLHLLIVIAGAILGVDAYRVAYPVLAITIALKAGFVFLIAHDALAGARARLPLALSAVGLALFAPRAYSVDGFLRAGFYAQVAAELFVVAGWWGLARWWGSRSSTWLAFVGLMGAGAFLTWPIWVGPLAAATGVALIAAHDLAWRARTKAGAIAAAPLSVVAAVHLAQHAAWLRLAGTGGAVPRFAPDAAGWALIVLALAGAAVAWRRPGAWATLWFAVALLAQALALYGVARARGAGTPYMAMKMIYLGVYPVAVLGTIAVAEVVRRLPERAVWILMLMVCGTGLAHASREHVPPSVVDVDLHDAGVWARAHLESRCVDYIVDDADQAYWLHLAVMGQSRAGARTADIDHYTSNRAVGQWIEGTALPYAVAKRSLLPGDVLREAEVVHESGRAVVIRRRGAGC